MSAVGSPLVSVLIPTLNRPTLRRAVDSVLAQTYTQFELIVIDDHADPPVRVDAFGDAVRVIRLDAHGGCSAARNAGLAVSSSELVGLLDDDDWWRPTFLERTVEVLLAAPDDVAFVDTGFDLWHEGKQVRRHLPDAARQLPRDILVQPSIWPSTLLVRRRALDDVGAFNEALLRSEDVDLYLRLLKAGWRFQPLREVLVDRAWHVLSAESWLLHYRAVDDVIDERMQLLNERDRRRAQSRRLFDYGVLHARAGRRGDARKALWQAWRLYPRRVRPLTQLPRTVVGERIWARPAMWSHVARGRIARLKH
jgi:glycosyltransferase involved in cell wall biosynthesis